MIINFMTKQEKHILKIMYNYIYKVNKKTRRIYIEN